MTQEPKKIWKVLLASASTLIAYALVEYVVIPTLALLVIVNLLDKMPTTWLSVFQLVLFATWLRAMLEYVTKTIGDAWYGSKYNKQK